MFPQGLAHTGVYHPRLRPKKKYRLHNCLKKRPKHPYAVPLPYQYPFQMGPDIPGPMEVTHHCHILVVRCCYDQSQVFEGYYCLDRPTVILKGPYRAIPHLLCCQPFLLRSTPLSHWAVVTCCPFRDFHGTKISHRGHRGWGRFNSFNIITVSRTCL